MKRFSISDVSSPALEPNQTPSQCVLRGLFPRREGGHFVKLAIHPLYSRIYEFVELKLHSLMCLNDANKDNLNLIVLSISKTLRKIETFCSFILYETVTSFGFRTRQVILRCLILSFRK
jgi:hypothetical protein